MQRLRQQKLTVAPQLPLPMGEVAAKQTDEGLLPRLIRGVLRLIVEKQTFALLPFYRSAFYLQRGPHPTRLRRPTFPLGEGFGWYRIS